MAGDDLYEIEKIVSCRLATNGKISYLVRWKGYESNDDTWEPEDNLLGCKDAILRFFHERDVQPKRKDGYLILHLKKACPTPHKSTSWLQDERNYSLKNDFRNKLARGRSPKRDVYPGDSPMLEKLRLTPERRTRLVRNSQDTPEKRKYKKSPSFVPRAGFDANQSLQHVENKPHRRRRRSRSRNRTRRSKHVPTILIRDAEELTAVREHGGKIQEFCYHLLLSMLLSVFLIAVFYGVLVYDLS